MCSCVCLWALLPLLPCLCAWPWECPHPWPWLWLCFELLWSWLWSWLWPWLWPWPLQPPSGPCEWPRCACTPRVRATSTLNTTPATEMKNITAGAHNTHARTAGAGSERQGLVERLGGVRHACFLSTIEKGPQLPQPAARIGPRAQACLTFAVHPDWVDGALHCLKHQRARHCPDGQH